MTDLALVTGASSGIGEAFARRLAAGGHDLVVVGRDAARLDALAASLDDVTVRPVVADLATAAGVDEVAGICSTEPLTMLVNNAGVAHYMPLVDLPVEKASEVVHVKVTAPTLLMRAAAVGMAERGGGTIVNVAGMLAFGGPATRPHDARAVYTGSLGYLLAISQTLAAELSASGIAVQVVCPGIVATEFHSRQGLDLSSIPRMSADDVVTASLRGLELGEVVCAPGVERDDLLGAVFDAQIAAFETQGTELASRYEAG